MLHYRQPSFSDVPYHLPQVFKSYDGRSKFDSVLHTENDDVNLIVDSRSPMLR